MTSEQKLLQLIRKSVEAVKPARAAAAPSSADISTDPLRTERFWRLFNRSLTVIVVMTLAAVLARYMQLREQYRNLPVLSSKTALGSEPLTQDGSSQVSFEEVRPLFVERNIFRQPGSEDNSLPEDDEFVEEVLVPQVDLSQMYKIVGIALGESPTVIVESIQNSSTLFLGVGDMIESGVIRQILEDKVLVELNGQTVELK